MNRLGLGIYGGAHSGSLPQGGSVRDGEQGDAAVLGGLEDLSLHVDAHGTGALIQQGVFRPDTHRGDGCDNCSPR